MPYIVILTTRGMRPTADYPVAFRSSRAVATLEEARQEARRHIHGIDLMARLEVSLLFESGGTVGPLPDGTVIEVRRQP